MATYEKLENHVSLFDRKKEKKISEDLSLCYFGQHVFLWEVLKHETEAMLMWVRNKLFINDLVRM